MHSIPCRKIVFLLLLLIGTITSFAQPNLEQYDNRVLHFGFTLATNIGRAHLDAKTLELPKDSLRQITVKSFPGIGLGAITNLHLNDNMDIRLMAPVISFVQRNIVYQFENSRDEVKIESAYCDASLLFKYKSARRKNTRLYVIGGGRMSYDFASTVKKNRGLQDPVVSLNPITYGWEAGVGFDFYFEYFKFSPEIKACQTFGNAMYRDGFIFTNYIQNLSPQLIQISLHFE
ncbi:MAG: porin family protein [Bacteroidia bacterium]